MERKKMLPLNYELLPIRVAVAAATLLGWLILQLPQLTDVDELHTYSESYLHSVYYRNEIHYIVER